MIRLFLILIMGFTSLLAWSARDATLPFPVAAGYDWMRSFFQWPSNAVGTPEAEEEQAPFVSENRSLSATFRPILRHYAPALSVPTAHASVIIDAQTGEQLFGNHADDRRQIASLTKLFTALIVVERVKNLNEIVTVDEEAVRAEGVKVGCPRSGFCNGERLRVGEQLSVYDLLQAALMNSSNDAAIALGKHVGGTQVRFVDIMNARGHELGLTNSRFCTSSGLEIDGQENRCYSTAADIARVATEALKHEVLWEIMQQEKVLVTSADGQYTHEIFNTDQLLGQMPNLIGTKTGFTPRAGYSLLAVATDPTGTHKVVAVVLNDPYRWQSIRSMFDWSFQAFEWM